MGVKYFTVNNIASTVIVILFLRYFSLIFSIDFLDPIQNTLEDFQITDIVFSQIRDVKGIHVDSNIVLVNVGYLDRSGIAEIIERINEQSPKVVGVDIFFRERSSRRQDSALSKALAGVSNLVMTSELTDYDISNEKYGGLKLSHGKFISNAVTGYANLAISDNDFRTVRKFKPIASWGNGEEMAFPVSIARIYNPESAAGLIARHNEMEIINYRRNVDKYLSLNYNEVLSGEDISFINGKIVLIGFLGPDLYSEVAEDMFFSPMNSRYVGKNYPDIFGVVIYANIISMILSGDYCYSLPYWASLLFTIILVFLNMVFYSYLREKHLAWYESVSIIITFVQLAAVFLFILYMFYFFNIEMVNTGVFFAIVINKQAYEIWCDSARPIAADFYHRLFNRSNMALKLLRKD